MQIGDKVMCGSITPSPSSGNLTLGAEYEVSGVTPSRDGEKISLVDIDGLFEALDFRQVTTVEAASVL
ncbi:hypothetical protein [Aliirhizobium cellulosilyticum]|uniref:Uncharacterized protein n=1 Tax=Aliirhizobium cellulosilyticum TaxID=393664 RepID=A0A7W6UU29_9HYPH|nr:hypothetical protein [Rhizobium cellulosilyticum]MBB4348029.1 hypothetical protein [Rhizobium cellulosilyticum]MBB4409577.1 hypothetical protein [Rhizobium cellulosilyticum]MBB4444266.1 hypothetical protein [Rhizobium cellulosilyticum]